MDGRSGDYILKAGESIARFSASGAECRGWRIGSRELLWPGDPQIWPQVAPILFPVCGWSRGGKIRVGEADYDMPVHGFAAASVFEVDETRDSEIRFTLRADASTRAIYPFDFLLQIAYRLTEDGLAVEISVANAGAASMPYACGIHPGFVWRSAGGPHRFVFAGDVSPETPVIAPGGLFSSEMRPAPLSHGALDLSPDLFAREALCFLDLAERRFTMESPDGHLETDAPDFPHLILWNRAGGDFLAIESWTGIGDPVGFEGDLEDRPWMIRLAPGDRRSHRVQWRWRPRVSARLAAAVESA